MDPTALHSPRRPIRIGAVPYGVGAKLLCGLDDDPAVALSRMAPSALVPELRAGRIDAALVSSIEAFRSPGYLALSDIGICADGPVRSVRAFRKGDGPVASVGLTRDSEASVALLRILLTGPLQAAVQCRFERVASTRTPDDLPQDLVLLIGDDGLAADPGARQPLDLGEVWREWTGLPFVFALWVLRGDADEAALALRLRRARERARGLPREAREGGVHYDLGDREHAGLARFRDEAVRAGLATEGVQPRFV